MESDEADEEEEQGRLNLWRRISEMERRGRDEERDWESGAGWNTVIYRARPSCRLMDKWYMASESLLCLTVPKVPMYLPSFTCSASPTDAMHYGIQDPALERGHRVFWPSALGILFFRTWYDLIRALSHQMRWIRSKVVWQCVDLQRPSLCRTQNWSRQALVNRCKLGGMGWEGKWEEGTFGALTNRNRHLTGVCERSTHK